MNMGTTFAMPGIVRGERPERHAVPPANPLTAPLARWARALGQGGAGLALPRLRRCATRALARAARLDGLAGDAWAAQLAATRAGLVRDGATDRHCIEAFALAALACRRHFGHTPYPGQLVAARAMLAGRLVEMATGEGKTLALAIAAATAALAGAPVHVITANDYLAARDAGEFAAFHAALGLRVAHVEEAMGREARRRAYAADITHCTARELAFDYLRDALLQPHATGDLDLRARRLAGRAPPDGALLRGLCVALVDEADTLLIDEARVPLVLSRAGPDAGEARLLAGALALARQLEAPADFEPGAGFERLTLTAAGRARVAAAALEGGPGAAVARHREDCVRMALAALHHTLRDRDYVVVDGAVRIVDEHTGRVAGGRAWSRGLHQLVEMKEGLRPSAPGQTAALITYPRLFARYLHIAGMSGTLTECAGEMRATYGLGLVRVPPRAPSRRRALAPRLFADNRSLFAAVAERAAAIAAAGRPVLIGTASVAESEHLAQLLARRGLPHALLNARDPGAEAGVIAAAGRAGRITVATSMAGRGTDIGLDARALAAGGLHVILCQANHTRRVDRQFIGRAARRGEPGSFEVWRSLEAPLFARHLAPGRRSAACRLAARWPRFADALAAGLQWLEERAQARQRADLCRADDQARRAFAFSPGVHP
jgi:preprotein translocase subunit SecA